MKSIECQNCRVSLGVGVINSSKTVLQENGKEPEEWEESGNKVINQEHPDVSEGQGLNLSIMKEEQ